MRCEDSEIEDVSQGVPVIGCSKSEGVPTKDGAKCKDGEFDEFPGPRIEARIGEVQRGREVERCFPQ